MRFGAKKSAGAPEILVETGTGGAIPSLASVSGRPERALQEAENMKLNTIDRVAFVIAGVLASLILAGYLLT